MKHNRKSTILLVDDKPANIMVLENLLEKKDRILLKAESGTEALKLALSNVVDLIILDVQMPAMDGFEVSQILKSNKRTKDIPIIFASAEKKEHKFMMKGFEEGAVDYIFKPLDPEITKAKVSVLLKLQMQKKELIEKNISLERSALLINNSADIIGIIDAATLKFRQINQAFTSILGYLPEEINGTSLEFFLTNEDRNLIRNLKTNDREKVSFETRVYCKDRSIKWLQWNVVIKDHEWFVNARDITLNKQVEKIKDYLSTIVKQSNDAIYIHDDNGQVISWNVGAEKIYGYTEQEALKMKIWNIIPEYLHEETQLTIEKIIEGHGLQFLETKRITKHGRLVDVFFSASVILDPESGKKSVAITERDITEQKIAEDQILQLNANLEMNVIQLEGANKELEAFSYSVSHDLRAPLRAVNGYANILLEDYEEKIDEDGISALQAIMNNSKKMGMLIDDLLAFSRLGRKEIAASEINMNALVYSVRDEMLIGEEKEIEFKVEQLPPALGDQALIKQVWINLISNAVKYSKHKPKTIIEIGGQNKGSQVEYFVKDNGAGFDMKYYDKLFGVFQRLHSEEEFEGTGIGLAIVQKIINRHSGTVWAESKLHDGTTFYFSLPQI